MEFNLKSDHGKFCSAEDGGGNEGQVVDGRPAGLLTATRDSAGGWETFLGEWNEDGTFSPVSYTHLTLPTTERV